MTTEADLFAWVNRQFIKIIGTKVDEAVIHYFLTLESDEDTQEFLKDLFPNTLPTDITEFINQLRARKIHPPPTHETSVKIEKSKIQINPHQPVLSMPLIPDAPKRSKKQNPAVVREGQDTPKPYMKPSQDQLVYMPERKHINNIQKDRDSSAYGTEENLIKKRSSHKFVPFTSSEGSRVSTRLPGRHACQCIGQKHALINNCTECGRIVCSQEGAGPCLFCGALVVSQQDQETLNKGGKKASNILDNINRKFDIQNSDDFVVDKKNELAPSSFKTAVAYKNRLLEYDRTCQQRTKVYDDESDYYRATKWMSPEQAARAEEIEDTQHKLKHPSKRGAFTVTLDISGKQAIEEEKPQLSEQAARDFIERGSDYQHTQLEDTHNDIQLNTNSLAHPSIPFTPKFLLKSHQPSRSQYQDLSSEKLSNYRIQDSHLAELSDRGSCLSMHQPWASLLVCGIKRIEGRTWYTTHRGRLWIASTARTPIENDINDVETFYRTLYGPIEFPDSYPTSTLLGCVNLKDCLIREDYTSLPFSDESESPYGFICEDPHFLKMIVPIKGMHKIWKLDKSAHNIYKRYLSPSNPIF
ncbi:Activating signal cointegrator 1-like [Oopsacas minuta]|uniref:Activating signal cointegrator 1-like n=1 Tax=Oopsacas minuta TaxID=111878 RepID=A0AAV7JCH9_9METZ|nr:Activating signal cointegrator 1-like [Oopsacas minuta]